MKKYELTDETRVCRLNPDFPVTLHRIRALKDFGSVKAGDLGGFVAREDNLSHDGNCWVGDESMVFGKAMIADNAQLRDRAMAYGYAVLRENAILSGSAKAFGESDISGDMHYDSGWILHHVGDISGEFTSNMVIP